MSTTPPSRSSPLPLATPSTNRQRPNREAWSQLKAAYLAGAELRPLARAIGLAEGTVLSRASREKWADQRDAARAQVTALGGSLEELSQSIAVEREQRAQRHLDRMGNLTECVGDRVHKMTPIEALDRIHKISIFDRLARRALGLDLRPKEEAKPPLINVAVLSLDGPSLVRDLHAEKAGQVVSADTPTFTSL